MAPNRKGHFLLLLDFYVDLGYLSLKVFCSGCLIIYSSIFKGGR